MRPIELLPGADGEGFRRAVRGLLATATPPAEVAWSIAGEGALFAAGPPPDGPAVALPRAVAGLAAAVVCHRDPERYALLYTLIWRIRHDERALLGDAADPLVHRLQLMERAIRRDLHKMHAFLKFRRIGGDESDEHYIAFFEPDHHILEAAAPFFVERFRGLRWSILTPEASIHWDGTTLTEGPGGTRNDVPATDAFDAGWRRYYESTFNPARLNPVAMRREMAKKYWHNMPETAAIGDLIRSAPARVTEMIEREAAMPAKRNPERAVAAMADQDPRSLEELNRIIAASPPLVPGATRAVLGEGPIGAAVAFVGEQPGDEEDEKGHPFVGPAGRLLDRAMADAGLDRSAAYVTNAVKHFKFERRGKKRIHQRPTAGEVKHYRWWLMKELDFVHPRLVVALGATAILALAGKALPVNRSRGEADFEGRRGFITVHPSYLLRLPDEAARREEYQRFVSDLRRIGELAAA